MRYVVCGEALIDLVRDERSEATSQESAWRALSGGGPMNTAVALARLGAHTEFLGRLGADPFGAQLKHHIQSAGLGLELAREVDEPTSLAVVGLDAQGKATYTFHLQGTANFGWQPGELPELDENDWLHFGSLATLVQPGADTLLQFVRETAATVSYDINVRPSVVSDPAKYWDAVEPFLEAVGHQNGIAKASDDDIRFLIDNADTDLVEVAGEWAARYGLAMMIVTLGPDGAVTVRSDGRVDRVPGRRVDVVDTVGAGDTFMAGFLTGYVSDPSDVSGALTRGVAAASLVCQKAGANPPTSDDVDRLLEN